MDIARSATLHARTKAMIAAFDARFGVVGAEPRDAAGFDALACDIARYQAEHSPGYGRLCAARGLDPATLTRAVEIPAVPTDAFRVARVATFDRSETYATFRTSGTTAGAEERGSHDLRDLSTYDAGAVAFGRHALARDLEGTMPVVVLHPTPSALPESSLAHMCSLFVKAFGEPAPSRTTWLIDGDVLDLSAFDERVALALAREAPVLVLATSFALVHFLDGIGDATFGLPPGSRVMQTGGFKGRSREVAPDELRAELARVFAIDPRAIVAEYGMTELSSQFYEQTFFDPEARAGVYAEPPWARVIPVDPTTLEPVADGEIGLGKIVDLANVDSAVAVLTQDRVRRVDGGFELLGRATGAPSRGCSIAIDDLLGRSAN